MYMPSYNRLSDRRVIADLVRRHSFGLLISAVDGAPPEATHIPFLYEADVAPHGRLTGHLARANPHWRSLDGTPVMALFQGPHAHISPDWYGDWPAVPTWNYVSIHMYGTFQVMQDPAELLALLERTVRMYEPASPLLASLGEDYYARLAQGVVGFAIAVDRLEAKEKMSQNKPVEIRRRVADGLRERGLDGDEAVARWMEGRGLCDEE